MVYTRGYRMEEVWARLAARVAGAGVSADAGVTAAAAVVPVVTAEEARAAQIAGIQGSRSNVGTLHI